MVLTFPRSFPDPALFESTSFSLLHQQELNPLRSGKVLAADLGPALWHARCTTNPLTPENFGILKSFFATVSSLNEFYLYDVLRQYPLAYAEGWGDLEVAGSPFDGTANLSNVESNNVEIDLTELPPYFSFSRGDYMSFDYSSGTAHALHMVVNDVDADGAGAARVEVRPAVRAGWTAATSVQLYRPTALVLMLPASYSEAVNAQGFGVISFEALQTLDA